MIRHGLSARQIASVLVLSTQTVQTYRKNIRRKLGILNKRVSQEKYISRLECDAADYDRRQ